MYCLPLLLAAINTLQAYLPNLPPEKTEARTPATDSSFVDILTLDSTFVLDIRYATDSNFTKARIYDCPACLLRPEVANALAQAHAALRKKGYRIILYDCYRPQPYQQRLWDKVPDPNYVTPPAKGSMHSRGAAVDLGLADSTGRALNMGTPYDFFGPEAHSNYAQLPDSVKANRQLLRSAMDASGFSGIRTEWWHFYYRNKKYPLSSYVWPCE